MHCETRKIIIFEKAGISYVQILIAENTCILSEHPGKTENLKKIAYNTKFTSQQYGASHTKFLKNDYGNKFVIRKPRLTSHLMITF